jgi:hypothetical protein
MVWTPPEFKGGGWSLRTLYEARGLAFLKISGGPTPLGRPKFAGGIW